MVWVRPWSGSTSTRSPSHTAWPSGAGSRSRLAAPRHDLPAVIPAITPVIGDALRRLRRREPASSSVVAAVVAVVLTLVVVAGVLLATGPGSEPSDSGEPLVVSTGQGTLRGVDEQGVRTWRGIPYAAAPVGNLRWRPPAQAPTWEGELAATSFGAPCLQPAGYRYGDRGLKPRRTSSEDCLYLNVTSAYGDEGAAEADPSRPVIVWLHGGGLFEGNGSLVDPTVLAEHGTVVVTVNYRLGLLGFFAHPALDQDVANFALLDQVAALEWVRDNIAGFGGDPDNVTVMGGSAGAISVNALMVAPAADGLFDRAISQSAPGDSAARTLRDVRRQGARAFGGLSATELQALPPEDLLSSTFNVLLGDAPIVDAVLPERVADAFAAGREASVPYLVGTTSGEFSDGDFRASGSNPTRIRSQLGGAEHDALVAAYGRRAFREFVLDDLVFHAPAAALALEHAQRAPTYRYRFGPDRDGSTHGAEVPYVFGSEDRPGRQRLAEAMVDYWVAFARTGEPEVEGLPTWPRAAGTSYLDLGVDGPQPVERDPWTRRLRALYETVPLQLPESLRISGARGR